MKSLIDVIKFEEFCSQHEIVQSCMTGHLLVEVGKTEKGETLYEDLFSFDEIYSNLQA